MSIRNLIKSTFSMEDDLVQSVTPRDYFVAALRAEAWRHRIWIYSVFNVVDHNAAPNPDDRWPYRLYSQQGQLWFVDPNNNHQLTLLRDSRDGTPLVGVKETFTLRVGELPNVTTDVNTTYGNALFNAVAICMPFGDTIPYVNGKMKSGQIQKLFVSKIVSDPAPGEAVPPGKVTVSQVHQHLAAMHDVIQNLDKLCVQSVSPHMLEVSPEVLALRDRLLEENKDRLNDLTVVAAIVKQLIEADKATFKGDPAEGFFIKDKQFAVARFRTKIMHGIEHSFDGDGTFELVTKSLSEGWDFKMFPALNNSLRDGSYNRGAKTALGGEAVKFFYRRYQNSRYVPGDCGTRVTVPKRVTKANADRLVGNYFVDGAEITKITPEMAPTLVGRTLQMRDPGGCQAGLLDYCSVCFGESLESSPEMIANITAEVASRFMSIFMAKMHGTQLRTTRVDFNFWIR